MTLTAYSLHSRQIGGLILAGGRGRRMGGRDKGLLEFRGRPLVAHVADSLRPQVNTLYVNANRHLPCYQALGCPIIRDPVPGAYAGPLAGMVAAMRAGDEAWWLIAPCDTPFLPDCLGKRLWQAVEKQPQAVDIAVSHDGERPQWLCALLSRRLLPALEDSLARGECKVEHFYRQHRWLAVDFSDQPRAFVNFNRPDQLAAWES